MSNPLEARKIRETEYYQNPWKCIECNNIISYDAFLAKRKRIKYNNQINIFCSLSCSAKHNNIGITNASRHKQCLQCGTNHVCKKFCSHKCQKLYELLKDSEIFFSNSPFIFGKVRVKHILIHKYGYKCMMSNCGWDMSKKHTVLEIDHIDGNSENWKAENIRLICPNCHSQTNTYKGKNFGNGRYKRRERYKQGLLY